MLSNMIIGIRTERGISTILVKSLIPVSPKSSMKKFAMTRQPTMNQNMSGLSIISIGPGFRPWMNRAPIMMAVTASPGMPRVIIGMNAPPTAELFAVSGATSPSIAPSPNSRSGFFVTRLAWS